MKHLLLIRFSALGDVAMLVPVIRQYITLHPDHELTVLSRPFCAPLFADLGPHVHFIGADLKGEYSGISGLTRLFFRLHRMHFTEVCDMHSVIRTHYLTLLFRLFGYRVNRIHKLRHERRLITAPEPHKQLRRLTTSFDKYRVPLHLPPTGGGPDATDTNEETSTTDTTAATCPPPVEERWRVAIAPFAAHKGKIYPPQLMQQVIGLIIERHPTCTIYLFGGGGDELAQMQQWADRWPSNVIVASTVAKGLEAELALMRTLDVMLSMDSANMHLASLVGLRTVSIWGATHPWAGFLGWGQSEADCVQVDLPCRPCSIYGNKPCLYSDYRCLTSITPRQIVERLEAVPHSSLLTPH